jgi:hypothetical protein
MRDLCQDETDFLRAVCLYLTSYFNGRTSFTGLKFLIEDIENEASIGDDLSRRRVERRHKFQTVYEYFDDELARLARWLEFQFSEVSFVYNNLRLRTFRNG